MAKLNGFRVLATREDIIYLTVLTFKLLPKFCGMLGFRTLNMLDYSMLSVELWAGTEYFCLNYTSCMQTEQTLSFDRNKCNDAHEQTATIISLIAHGIIAVNINWIL